MKIQSTGDKENTLQAFRDKVENYKAQRIRMASDFSKVTQKT